MSMSNESCAQFLDSLASKAPVPGGGGASALVGAVGAALGSMVGNLTVGNSKYANVQDQIVELNERAKTLRLELLHLIDEDAKAFEPLAKAYSLPTSTAEEKAYKRAIMEKALLEACNVPLKIMATVCEVIALHKDYEQMGSQIAISDVGVGVACCRSALLGASLNIFINTKSMADRTRAVALNGEAHTMLVQYTALADAIFERITNRFV